MKPPAAAVKKAIAKKMKARGSPGRGRQEPAPKRLRIQEPQPPAQEEPFVPAPSAIDLTADSPPEGAGAEKMIEEGPSAAKSTAAEPQGPDGPSPAEANRSWEAGPSGVAGSAPGRSAEDTPSVEPAYAEVREGRRAEAVPRGFSLMNDGRRVEQLIAQIIQPDFLEELRHLEANRFFREASSAFVRAIHSFVLAREAIGEHEALGNQLLRDAEDARVRVEAAEQALASVKSDCATKIKEAEDKAGAAERRQQLALNQLADAQDAVEARNLHIADLGSSIQAAEDRLKEVEGRLEEAEVRLEEAEGRASRAEKEASVARKEREAQVAEAKADAETRVASAVEEFRASELFVQEVSEANADYFFEGFEKAREKIARVLNVPQALEIEPDQVSEEHSDSEPAASP